MANNTRSTRRRIGCAADGRPLDDLTDSNRHSHMNFEALEDEIAELGHVNNAAWVV
ncbi:hypothetical protein [Sphingobium sp.]|uniref:hypothetical protein n=1 Tax=Sphingobium sp. TaxID=1912891 RepID=UPI00257C82E4|nr:hypothetical protein [Sphingobium sp.]